MAYFKEETVTRMRPYIQMLLSEILHIDPESHESSLLEEEAVHGIQTYGFAPDEIFSFRILNRPVNEIETYISEKNRYEIYDRVNAVEDKPFFTNKYQTYQKFQKFFKRNVCPVSSPADISAFADFAEVFPTFVIKPQNSTHGHKVRPVTYEGDFSEFVTRVFTEYQKDFMLEEMIVQSETTGKYHPSSVNTVRIDSFRCDDRVEIIASEFRMGCGDSFADNFACGGCMALIDKETGCLTRAADHRGNAITVHPDTGVQITGEYLPDWDELRNMVEKMAQVIPTTRLIGWDLAHTENGWVLVEANNNPQFGVQMLLPSGLKPRIDALISEIK